MAGQRTVDAVDLDGHSFRYGNPEQDSFPGIANIPNLGKAHYATVHHNLNDIGINI